VELLGARLCGEEEISDTFDIGSIAEKKIRQKINGFKKLFGGPLTINYFLGWKV
jgi:hypothetical protein